MNIKHFFFISLCILICLLSGCKKPVGSKPRIVNADFITDVFTVENDIKIMATVTSPTPATVTYTWFVNGNEVYDVNENTLASSYFQKRNTVSCRITVVDSMGQEAEPVTLGPVTINNALPSVTWADIVPSDSIYKGNDLFIEAETADPDDDDVEIRYTWYVGNSLVSSDSFLDGNLLVAGENVLVELVPFDGDTTGQMYEVKRPIIVQNTPPKIFGVPTAVIQDSLLTCRISARDPDGDPITYAIESGPSGMSIDSTGLIQWIFPPPANDTIYIITVLVTDDKGAGERIDIPLQVAKQPDQE